MPSFEESQAGGHRQINVRDAGVEALARILVREDSYTGDFPPKDIMVQRSMAMTA